MVAPLVAVLFAAAAPAAPTLQQSRDLFQQGQADFKAGKFKDAVDAFIAADRLNPSPDLMYDVAQAYERLGELTNAIDYYQTYLARRPDAPDAAAVHATIDNLRAHLGAADPVVVLTPDIAAAAVPLVPLVTAEEKKPFHPSPIAIAFGVGGVIAAGFAIGGAIDVLSFQSTRNKVQQPPATISYVSAQAQANSALGWGIASICLSIAAVGGVAGAVLTW